MNAKIDNIELRIVLIGEVGVGKRTIVKRFKILNCTETKDFYVKKNKTIIDKKKIKVINDKTNKDKDNTNTLSNTNTLNDNKSKKRNELAEILKEEEEQKKYK